MGYQSLNNRNQYYLLLTIQLPELTDGGDGLHSALGE